MPGPVAAVPSRALAVAAVVVATVALGGPGAVRPAGAADAPPDGAPKTHLEAGVLPRADVVVIGRVRVLVPPRGMGSMTVVRVETEKVLRGQADPQFTLFVGGARNTADPNRPAEAYLPADARGRYALFLKPSPKGSGFGLEALFSVDDPEGKEKADVLERELAVAAIADPAERGRRLVAMLLDLLDTSRTWTRLHAARELEAVAVQQPALLTASVRAEVEAVARKTFDEILASRLRRVLRAAAAAETGAPDAGEDGAAGPARSAAYLRAARRFPGLVEPEARIEGLTELARLGKAAAAPELLPVATGDPTAAVRERATVLLGDVGARTAATPLRDRFGAEPDPAVREAIVRSVGLLGDDEDVPWLVAHGGTPGLRKPVGFALARIRTESALEALAALGRTAADLPPPDDDLPRLIEYLRTPAFVEAERLAGRTVGPRPRRTPAAALRDGGGPPPADAPCPAPEGPTSR